MGEKALWPATVLVSIVIIVLGGLLAIGVQVVDILAMWTVVSGILNLMLYNNMQSLKQQVDSVAKQTNGQAKDQQEFIRDLVNHLKTTVPLQSQKDE